jgi:Ser/Thr protein kinase RdoA (MazF antagonist)
MLSRNAQVRRLRHLAVTALSAYLLTAPRLRFVTHGGNTTFRVDAMTHRNGRVERFLLRVHRPGRHGPSVDSRVAVGSELRWLAALRADTDLAVPEPIRTHAGELTTTASTPSVHGSRVCSLLRWMDGCLRRTWTR